MGRGAKREGNGESPEKKDNWSRKRVRRKEGWKNEGSGELKIKRERYSRGDGGQ